MSEKEIAARPNLLAECPDHLPLALEIEVDTFCDLIHTKILPAAISYQKRLLDVIKGLKELNNEIPASSYKSEVNLLKEVTKKIEELKCGTINLTKEVAKGEKIENLPKKGKFFAGFA